MNEEKLMTDPAVLDGSKLWDEIFKAMIGTMPEQIFPVIKEVYDKTYPKGTPITILGTETSNLYKRQRQASILYPHGHRSSHRQDRPLSFRVPDDG